jgi:epoxyqueuosine reductase
VSAPVDWPGILAGLEAAGWHARAVPVERLAEVAERVAGVLASGELPGPVAAGLRDQVAFELPAGVPAPRAVIVGAVARPLTQATLTLGDDRELTVPVPPHYAGYHTMPDRLAAAAAEALAAAGYSAARCEPPLKTLAACAGLARYGRNNIAYVPGLGSYLQLAACVSDAPPPEAAAWGEPQALECCEHCVACARACPTGAIAGQRFLLDTGRCLTWLNEDPAPFPEWVDPAWHTCAVGCLRCQQACPENAVVDLAVSPPEVFDAAETAAILAATPAASLPVATAAKLTRCGLDYSPELIARNLAALLPA